MDRVKGILYAAVSSSTFGLAPFFSLTLLMAGFSSCEILSYRWGVASIALALLGWSTGCRFRIGRKEMFTVFCLSLFRAATSFSLLIAYQNISSGVASIIHFMYPLVVAGVMMFFFKERKSVWLMAAILISIAGAILLSCGDIHRGNGNSLLGILAACVAVFAYAGYIIGVQKSPAAHIHATVLACYVMGIGALFFIGGATFTSGIRMVTDGYTWLIILGLALPATAISNLTLVQAIKYAGSTLTSILGALEPLTAVVIGVCVFNEAFTLNSALGVTLIIIAVTFIVIYSGKKQ